MTVKIERLSALNTSPWVDSTLIKSEFVTYMYCLNVILFVLNGSSFFFGHSKHRYSLQGNQFIKERFFLFGKPHIFRKYASYLSAMWTSFALIKKIKLLNSNLLKPFKFRWRFLQPNTWTIVAKHVLVYYRLYYWQWKPFHFIKGRLICSKFGWHWLSCQREVDNKKLTRTVTRCLINVLS